MDIRSFLEKIIDLIDAVRHTILLLRPLTEQEKKDLAELSKNLGAPSRRNAEMLTRQLRVKPSYVEVPYSETITGTRKYLALVQRDRKIAREVKKLNDEIEKSVEKKITEEFKKDAWSRLQKLFAPEIVGFENVKRGVILELFSKEQFHILLLGDPGTGKTDILRAAEELSPVSAFGLGSGTSNTGLTVTVKGHEISKGILSLADGGIALIDELNLMKKEDRAGLYNAMEKGFITFDKGGHHYRFSARCSVLASANPAKDKFTGRTKKDIKKQIPFDSALLSRFHLLYLIKEADIKQFMEITEKVFEDEAKKNKSDTAFLRSYIIQSRVPPVEFGHDYSDMIKKFVKEIKEKEKRMLIDITPRFVIGLKRLIEASARMEHRTRVEKEDVWRAMEVFTLSMKEITF